MLKISALQKTFHDGDGEHKVLRRIDLQCAPAEAVAITGESGGGKSTLLHLIAGLDQADAGDIRILDINLGELAQKQMDALRKQHIGIVFQQFNLIDCLSCWDNVLFVQRINHCIDETWARELFKDLDLDELRDRMPDTLSGGQQQRLAIARALAHRPRLVLADEPTGNLDDNNSQKVQNLLFSLCKKAAVSLIIVTHSEAIAAQADRKLHLKNGELHEYA